MKLISFLNENGQERAGLWVDGNVVDLKTTMAELLNNWEQSKKNIDQNATDFVDKNKIKFLAPVPHPPSCRDAYAFRQHVAAARRNRGVDMVPEFDQFPIFYFTNHNAIVGEGEIKLEKDHFEKLDFELEVAAVIGKKGRNIEAKDADSYIAGFTIMNDFSARRLQMEEMKLNLGPAKGKDFATAIGPWLVTTDELESFKVSTPEGTQYNLSMKAYHNEKQVSEGNMKDMTWTFAQIIERCSYGVDLLAGDVIGSGTVGTGCYMELNGTWRNEAKKAGKEFTPIWIEPGDMIELEIQELGRLKNTIKLSTPEFSILAKKKNI